MKLNLGLASVLLALTAGAQQMIYTPGETMGIHPVPLERNEWHGEYIAVTQNPQAQHYRAERSLDFFVQEYGAPLPAFTFEVTTGRWERVWGGSLQG